MDAGNWGMVASAFTGTLIGVGLVALAQGVLVRTSSRVRRRLARSAALRSEPVLVAMSVFFGIALAQDIGGNLLGSRPGFVLVKYVVAATLLLVRTIQSRWVRRQFWYQEALSPRLAGPRS